MVLPGFLERVGQEAREAVVEDRRGADGCRPELRRHRLQRFGDEWLHLPLSLDPERAVVTLGEWPEAGDTEQGQDLPAYRELARVLEPWLFHEEHRRNEFTPEDLRRWERRFVD